MSNKLCANITMPLIRPSNHMCFVYHFYVGISVNKQIVLCPQSELLKHMSIFAGMCHFINTYPNLITCSCFFSYHYDSPAAIRSFIHLLHLLLQFVNTIILVFRVIKKFFILHFYMLLHVIEIIIQTELHKMF